MGCVNVYGPRDLRERLEVWRLLENLCEKEEIKWVVFGDFNEVRSESERKNSVTNSKGTEGFNNFIRSSQLSEVPMGGQKFTRVSDDGRKFSKLDRFLVSNSFGSSWKCLGVKALDRKWSDHFSILLSDKRVDFGPKPFKLFDTWLCEEGIENVVREAWNKEVKSKNLDSIFRDKLKNVKEVLKRRSKERLGTVEKNLSENKEEAKKLEELAESRNLDDNERDRWLESRKRWLEAEKKKWEMEKQRAKIK